MKVHFIAIGGSAMHNLAIALHQKGYEVTGSDDEIFEPSKGRLQRYGLLPNTIGWEETRIHENLDAVILGMHARKDNPEIIKAQALGLTIYSYPEYLYQQIKNKTRVVIGGSHGKTSITAMILHVLHHHKIDADYMVGAQLEGFECMVRLSESAPVAILEGDEYLSSPIDRRPKFHLYQPNIALISGIAWDHINVFPTFENYVEQFQIFINKIVPDGTLIYCEADAKVKAIGEESNVNKEPYTTHPHEIKDGITYLLHEEEKVPLLIFGDHNLQNLNGARLVCEKIGISRAQFYEAITSFKGASKRLELVGKNNHTVVYKDFAHSPSKLKATTEAVKAQFPHRKLWACMELHTFSSLNETFLQQYEGAMAVADRALVYYSPQTIAHKKLTPITPAQVKAAFASENVEVFTDSKLLLQTLEQNNWQDENLLMMSSGNFDGIDFNALAEKVLA